MRIPDGRESTILSYLDRGIRVIIVPNLQTREEAEALVRYAFFAPIGLRSATSLRMVLFQEQQERPQLYADINANTLVVPQIESITAVENLDAILAVDGIDYFAQGPEDMAQSLSLPGRADHPRVIEAYARAEEKIRAAGKHWYSDIVESISVLQLIREGGEALLNVNFAGEAISQ